MDWTQALTIIGSILIPMLAGFGWMIIRMDAIKKELAEEIKSVEKSLTVDIKAIEKEQRGQSERLARIEGAMWNTFRNGTEK
jgi:hypothetical protein